MAKPFFDIGDEVFIRDDWDEFVHGRSLEEVLDRTLKVVDVGERKGYVIVEYHRNGKPFITSLPVKILGKEVPKDATIPW